MLAEPDGQPRPGDCAQGLRDRQEYDRIWQRRRREGDRDADHRLLAGPYLQGET